MCPNYWESIQPHLISNLMGQYLLLKLQHSMSSVKIYYWLRWDKIMSKNFFGVYSAMKMWSVLYTWFYRKYFHSLSEHNVKAFQKTLCFLKTFSWHFIWKQGQSELTYIFVGLFRCSYTFLKVTAMCYWKDNLQWTWKRDTKFKVIMFGC